MLYFNRTLEYLKKVLDDKELKIVTEMLVKEPLLIPTESKMYEIYKLKFIERGLRDL